MLLNLRVSNYQASVSFRDHVLRIILRLLCVIKFVPCQGPCYDIYIIWRDMNKVYCFMYLSHMGFICAFECVLSGFWMLIFNLEVKFHYWRKVHLRSNTAIFAQILTINEKKNQIQRKSLEIIIWISSDIHKLFYNDLKLFLINAANFYIEFHLS